MNQHDELPMDVMRRSILKVERELADSFAGDAGPELALVDDASAFVALVMGTVGQREVTLDFDESGNLVGGDVDGFRLYALQLIGARALRVVRAARASLSVGYEAETRAHDRILIELQEHRQAVMKDDTGNEARAWIEGERGRGISKRVVAMTPTDLYKNLCHDSHGDPVPVVKLIDKADNTLYLNPTRGPATTASLLLYAGFLRDQAVAIAAYAGIPLASLDDFDRAMDERWSMLDGGD